jgi:aflatoxin B1 aldehyde reductase
MAENQDIRDSFIIASKVNPWNGATFSAADVNGQMEQITSALKQDSVDILYLHAPDHNTPIEVTLEAVQRLFEQGKFRELGLSNYPAWQVAWIHQYNARKGFVLPTVYQGMYNAITRAVEAELVPCLRRCNIRFYVYNPLAGGMLTGKHGSFEAGAAEGRFAGNQMYQVRGTLETARETLARGTLSVYWANPVTASSRQDRFWKKSYFDALDVIKAACDGTGVVVANAALRWLAHHSALTGAENDGILIGASSIGHFEANLAGVQEGPLPQAVVDAFEQAWLVTQGDVPCYFR